MTDAARRPSVMFVCVHNAGRSQMAAAYARHLSGGAVEVRSAGSAPADTVNPAVHEAMLEEGIDLSAEKPTVLTPDAVEASDVVITMGCGDACPVYPGRRYLDWDLEDPVGKSLETVRGIRDDIESRVRRRIATSAARSTTAKSVSGWYREAANASVFARMVRRSPPRAGPSGSPPA